MRMRISLALLGALTLAFTAAACGGGGPSPKPVAGEDGFLYDVEGTPLYLECTGTGSPTLVLEAGLGSDHRTWTAIRSELTKTTRACTYDRSGISFSAAGPKRATAQEKVDDLHGLLDAADVDGPLVLVGHSFGGMLVRLYASTHPDGVAGIVLLEASTPHQERRFLAALPKQRAGESHALAELRRQLLDFRNPEGVDWARSSEQARHARSFGDLPMIVVTAGQSGGPPGPLSRRLDRAWLALQDDMARLSSDSIHVIATNSGHFVMSNLGQPDLVMRAIREVVAAVRERRPLRPCENVFPPSGRRCR